MWFYSSLCLHMTKSEVFLPWSRALGKWCADGGKPPPPHPHPPPPHPPPPRPHPPAPPHSDQIMLILLFLLLLLLHLFPFLLLLLVLRVLILFISSIAPARRSHFWRCFNACKTKRSQLVHVLSVSSRQPATTTHLLTLRAKPGLGSVLPTSSGRSLGWFQVWWRRPIENQREVVANHTRPRLPGPGS